MSNLAEFCDFTADAMAKKKQVDVLYCDAMKCFDTLHHVAIRDKLIQAGFSSSLTKLIYHYLRERKNFVVFENQKSDMFTPPSGVVQGSKLSSLLFILTFDDVKRHIRSSGYKMYADDIKIFKVIQSTSDCEKLQEDFDTVQNWMNSIGLKFHPNKCYKMSYTKSKTIIPYTYHIGDINLENIESYSDLGVTISNKLNWTEHIQDITSKSYKKLGMVIRFCKMIEDPDAILLLYNTIVRSKIEYCSPIWTPKTQTAMYDIERVQRCFVRYLFQKLNGFYPKYPNYIEYETLIENLPIESLVSRLKNNQIKYLKNILTNRVNSSELTSNIKFRVADARLRDNPDNNLFLVPKDETPSPTISAMKHYNTMNQKPDLFI
ncbi:hypothetical protein M8J77_015777 [Diaphorina citri]|nr:hypothetical protein M8J77_015777 [Diaphorina citri]